LSPPYANPPAPEIPLEATEASFWSVIEEVASGIDIHPGSESMLREMIRAGLKKMRKEKRTTPADLFAARGALANFVLEVKMESRTRGHSAWFGEDSTRGAAKRLLKIGIRLWPFFPPPWSTS
jgi:hypothetical protein